MTTIATSTSRKPVTARISRVPAFGWGAFWRGGYATSLAGDGGWWHVPASLFDPAQALTQLLNQTDSIVATTTAAGCQNLASGKRALARCGHGCRVTTLDATPRPSV